MISNFLAATALVLGIFSGAAAADALPSWKGGKAKQAIVEFVKQVTAKSGPKFLPPAQRIAVCDNDGTLWAEQPMLELLAFLRANGFKTFIVSGGGIEFMRVFSERVYGVPPEQVVGSYVKMKYEVRDGKPVVVRSPEIDFIDDKGGKPVGIDRFIGRRPILACGNSDGDFEMLEYTTSGPGPRLGLIVHHDDAEREYAYDRKSPVGLLERGLDEAPKRSWAVVSMKDDWRKVYD